MQFLILVIFFLSILLSSRRRRRLDYFIYRRRYFNDPYFDETAREGNIFFEHYVQATFRRRGALRRCRKFLTRTGKNVYTLKNKNVTFIFDSKKKTMFCLNIQNIKQSAYVEWNKQINSIAEEGYDNTFEKVFDSICISFDESSNYGGILNVLKTNFNLVKEILEENNIPKTQNNNNIITNNNNNNITPTVNKININNLSEDELANLPGINIVIAKKAIERINLKGEYKSIQDFYNEMKIKTHFQKQLDNLICAEPVKKQDDNNTNDDRIIDL